LYRRSPDGILLADDTGMITEINPAAAALLGVTPDSVIGRYPIQVFKTLPALMNLFNREGDQTLDVRLPRKRLAAGMAATLADGRRIILLHDVTEQRELESRREALSSTMTHDLRNPISALTGYTDLVARSGELNDEQAYFLKRVQQTTQKLYDVAGDLVDLVWLEAGMPMKHISINLRDVISDVIATLNPLAEKKSISIFVAIQDPLPPVMGDPDRIKVVISKLLHNALLYSDEERMVAVHAWGDTTAAFCSIADRGFGISEDEIEMVFDRLFRSKDERVQAIPGGGLGLTIARRIVQRHGGEISASSSLDKGSTFTFRLPSAQS
jgi:two-component system sensor histidine kinase ResE